MGRAPTSGYGGSVSTRDQLAVATLHGAASRLVAQSVLADEAVAELRRVTTRPDLLAQAAGILAGAAEPHLWERASRLAAARLLVAAGADRELLPRFIAEGRRNATQGVRGVVHARPWPDDLGQVLADVLDGSLVIPSARVRV
jgi:hypothetical protein